MKPNIDFPEDDSNTLNTGGFLAKRPLLRLFLIVEPVSALIGFVTIMPGKNNHIKEIPGLDLIIKREIMFLGVPLAIILFLAVYFHFHRSGERPQ